MNRREWTMLALIIALVRLAAPIQNCVAQEGTSGKASRDVFSRSNIVAWCIVPFDAKNRNPAQRAEMVKRLGLARVAYDWRNNHVAGFEEEILQYKKHGIEYFAFWGTHDKAFELFAKHNLRPQIWQTAPSPEGIASEARVTAAVQQLLPLVKRTATMKCKLGLYNHGGWGGEPDNLVAVCRRLRQQHQAEHVGIVYNLHHGHNHIHDFEKALAAMRPYLLCLNLNGMTTGGDTKGQKILPLGAGEHDLSLLKIIRDSKYTGPIGIIGHTNDDVEQRLLDNLDGLDWLLPQLNGKQPGPRPTYRTHRGIASPPIGAPSDSLKSASLLPSPATTFVQMPIRRAGGSRLKISLNAYSFNKMLSDHLKDAGKGMSLFELLDFCAEQNFDAVDPTGYYFPGYPKPPSDSYLNDFKRRAFVLGLDISGTGVRTHFASADAAKRAKDVEHVKEWVEVAARMGAPVLRVFAGAHPGGHSWDQVAAWMAADLKKCVAHGKKHGVVIGIQNHDDFLKNGEQTVQIVKMVDSEWFGVIVDTGAFLTPDPYKDIATVAPFAVNWQIKTHMGSKGAKVKTDFKRVVQIARDASYRGYLPIETLPVAGEPYDPLVRVPQALKELRSALLSD